MHQTFTHSTALETLFNQIKLTKNREVSNYNTTLKSVGLFQNCTNSLNR